MERSDLLPAPHLQKTGLILNPRPECATVRELFQKGLITREMMEEYGFLIIKKWQPQDDDAHEVRTENEQFFHSNVTHNIKPKILALHLPLDAKGIDAYTGIGEKEEIFSEIAKYLRRDRISEGVLRKRSLITMAERMKTLRAKIAQIGIEHILDEPIPDDQSKTWQDFLFHDPHIDRYPQLFDLNIFLRPKTYWHEWRPGDSILIDNEKMLHARIPYEFSKENPPENVIKRLHLDVSEIQ